MNIAQIELMDQTGTPQTLASLGKKVLLFAYPKDNTPGCTIENRDFSHLKDQFIAKGVTPVGISADSTESHTNFCNMHGLTTTLLSDPEMQLINAIGAYGEKKMYGKVIGKGIIRSSYLINTETGEIEKSWMNARAVGHAARVLKEIV